MTMWDDALLPERDTASPSDEERVLVAVVPRPRDWEIVQREHWYRIPVARAPRRLGAEYLAFYHTGQFAELKWSIAFYAPIYAFRLAHRRELLPDEPDHPRADALYYRVEIGTLIPLPQPIPSQHLRRLTFIMTTLPRLLQAREVNDLWERESARDRLWRALRTREIPARRDYAIREPELAFVADVAVFCARRNLAIECVEESDAPSIGEEAGRHGWAQLTLAPGWAVLRFSVKQVMGELEACTDVVRGFVAAEGGVRRAL